MSDDRLPTAEQILGFAAADLGDALKAAEECLAWLRSDWRPVGSVLTDRQAEQRQRMREAAAAIKRAVESATGER